MSTVQTKGDLRVKKWKCVVCKKKAVVESRFEHRLPADEVPDVGGCDYSTYTDHKVTGGKLLENRPDIPWDWALTSLISNSPLGGICTECLKTDTIKALSPNITFADELSAE